MVNEDDMILSMVKNTQKNILFNQEKFCRFFADIASHFILTTTLFNFKKKILKKLVGLVFNRLTRRKNVKKEKNG